MNVHRLSICILALSSAPFAPPAMAHHSPAAFNLDVTDFALTGTIEYVDFRNPHSVMELAVTEGNGALTKWAIEFSSVNLLLRRGWDFERITAGSTVTCVGNPSKDGSAQMYMWSIVLTDGTEFGR